MDRGALLIIFGIVLAVVGVLGIVLGIHLKSL